MCPSRQPWGPDVGIEEQGQVAGDQTVPAVRGEDGEALPPHELVELARVGLGEGGGDVHGLVLMVPRVRALALARIMNFSMTNGAG